MACVEGDGNDGVFAHIGEVPDGADAEFFVDDDVAGAKICIFNFQFCILNKVFGISRTV